MRKAFTLIELVVAVALLAMMISFASSIFDMSIDTHRTAMASAEIMQKLQAITGQLNADFKGLKISPQGKISFAIEQSVIAGIPQLVRSDSIVFFANGDFQSTKQYQYEKSGGGEGLKTVSGNVAAIFYGLADVNTIDPREKVLVRRQTILTSDTTLSEDFDIDVLAEYCNEDKKSSLSELIAEDFDANALMDRPDWDPNNWDPNDLVMYMAEGVDNFKIEWSAGIDGTGGIKWQQSESEYISTKAFKFTFTLYDSKGILKEGKTYTHIVYLGD